MVNGFHGGGTFDFTLTKAGHRCHIETTKTVEKEQNGSISHAFLMVSSVVMDTRLDFVAFLLQTLF